MKFSQEIMDKAKAWPFEQARLIVKRLDIEKKRGIDRGDRPVIFETGYGPSGLPHIGTFGEVVRTSMVMEAFRALTDDKIPMKLLCVSDDMDGMRKVPGNMPEQDMLTENLGKPLTEVPDPFGCHDSFGHHNNAKLCEFLDGFGFTYEFKSATELYKAGVYDDMLLKALEKFDDIMKVMLPTLGEERQATYSPFLPISPTTGHVLYVPMKSVDAKAGTITFDDEDGKEVTLKVTGGNTKLQWKPDFGMRWAALGVDFEMFGKDHQANSIVYSRICKILGAIPPVQYVYELFLDDKGEKISKSKGNGISIDEWLRYATPESLSLYMYTKPRTAKRLFFDVIPKAVDEYYQHLAAYPKQDEAAQINNPVWHIHKGRPPKIIPPISFALMLNIVSASNASDKDILWGFIERYVDGADRDSNPVLVRLSEYAIRYYADFVKPNKNYRAPTDQERAAMADLAKRLDTFKGDVKDASELQTLVFSVGKDHEFENLREWFKALYEVLLGQSQGPRFGSFVAIYGVKETSALIGTALSDKGMI
ncbi:MAG: lysine--tRNA ligase [Acidimicrobiales bacterium]|nr:lysine--tRNA ligase [Hyphomonadaceae bacterium]RZV44326.1 MAG: lysine--tRNA ligase [Acidimicrobiales bacterium]